MLKVLKLLNINLHFTFSLSTLYYFSHTEINYRLLAFIYTKPKEDRTSSHTDWTGASSEAKKSVFPVLTSTPTSSNLCLGLPSGLLLLGFPTKPPYAFLFTQLMHAHAL